MLSYRHAFHAGGAADVHKHAVLAVLLDHYCKQPKPFVVLDIYAGRGVYGLNSEEAQKRREFDHGIAKVLTARDRPDELNRYLASVNALNANGLTRYPGSPQIVRDALRADDHLIVNELHPTDHEALEHWAVKDPRIHVHKRDALEALIALTPPRIRRGLVLIDPAYEVKTEYDTVPEAVGKAIARWPQASYAIWYPVLPEARHIPMRDKLLEVTDAAIIQTEFDLGRKREYAGMQSSGLWIVNPPWHVDRALRTVGDWLATLLGQDSRARHRMSWLRKSVTDVSG
ncbi:MAG: 23S rRNA (adenine(2030)-N(6))-methyltransferase RlmJ [Rhodospirillaceae bacterium]|nr:23S rRNA (adenine(2030)-N(6))-methyltransferase RlmJ [Rhodospirillaceae bacterium]